jgi:hypothetical protein
MFVVNTQQCFAFTEDSSYSNVDNTMEGYKVKSALPFKIFSTLVIIYLPVDFEASLAHAKSNEIFSAGCEFA